MESRKLAILQAGECTAKEIIQRAKDFKISSKNFKLSVNERRIKDTNVPRQCQMSYRQEQYMYWCDYYPDLNDCLESTLDGSRMMPFSHQWLLKNGSSTKTPIKEGRVVNDFKESSDISSLNMTKERKQTDSFQRLQKDSCLLEKPTKGTFKTAENIENKEESVINSLEEYERVIEMAKSTAEKYNLVEESLNTVTNDICNKKQTNYLTKLQMKKNESLMDTMAESFVNEILRKTQVEMMKESINKQTHATKTDFHDKFKTSYLTKLQIKKEETDTDKTAETIVNEILKETQAEVMKETINEQTCTTTNDFNDKFQTNYLTKLQIKKEETYIDTTAETIVNETLRKTQVEMMKETINEQTHATTNDFNDKFQTSYLTKLQIKKEETYIDTTAETLVNEILRKTQVELMKESTSEQTHATASDINDKFQTSYLTKLQIKKEETYVDTTAETFVNEILKKTQEELIKESMNEQMHSLETVNSTYVNENQNIDHQSIDIESRHIDDSPKPKFSFISSAYGSVCMEHTKSFENINFIPVNESDKVESQCTYIESKYTVDTSKPKFSLISSAYGSIWMEQTEVPKRKSWRQRVKSVFCMGRCRVTS